MKTQIERGLRIYPGDHTTSFRKTCEFNKIMNGCIDASDEGALRSFFKRKSYDFFKIYFGYYYMAVLENSNKRVLFIDFTAQN